jgi:GDP-4-dehydro-6-deoxy-D-mannose reductase
MPPGVPTRIAPTRILLTGANGFVGQHLRTAIAAAFPGALTMTPEFEVTDSAAVDRAVRETMPDACVHLAAISTQALADADEDRTWAVNLHGPLHLARAILRLAPACQLVFVSSAETYGATFRREREIDEDAPLAPLNTYGATKAAADLALGAMAGQGLRVVRVRPLNHTGPGQGSGLVVASFARQLARIEAGLQEPVISVGNLEARRDFMDVRDVCAAYVACMARREAIAPGTILNLASGVPRRIGDILSDLITLAGVQASIVVDPGRTRATEVPLARCDAKRAMELIGWSPVMGWSQTLRDVLDDWRRRVAAEPEST